VRDRRMKEPIQIVQMKKAKYAGSYMEDSSNMENMETEEMQDSMVKPLVLRKRKKKAKNTAWIDDNFDIFSIPTTDNEKYTPINSAKSKQKYGGKGGVKKVIR